MTREEAWTAYHQTPSAARRNAVVVANMPLVKLAMKRSGVHPRHYDDLQQEGAMLLCRLVEQTKPGSKKSWSSYALTTLILEFRRYARLRTPVVRPLWIESSKAEAVSLESNMFPPEQPIETGMEAKWLSVLPERDREILVRKVVLEQPATEIAEAFGLSTSRFYNVVKKSLALLAAADSITYATIH